MICDHWDSYSGDAHVIVCVKKVWGPKSIASIGNGIAPTLVSGLLALLSCLVSCVRLTLSVFHSCEEITKDVQMPMAIHSHILRLIFVSRDWKKKV